MSNLVNRILIITIKKGGNPQRICHEICGHARKLGITGDEANVLEVDSTQSSYSILLVRISGDQNKCHLLVEASKHIDGVMSFMMYRKAIVIDTTED